MEIVSKKVVCVALLCMVLIAAAPGAEALTCGQVSGAVAPCIGYLRGGPLQASCCSGIRNLQNQAKTTADRQTACNCLKTAAGAIQGINFGKAAALPGQCGVSIPYKISPNTDCRSVK